MEDNQSTPTNDENIQHVEDVSEITKVVKRFRKRTSRAWDYFEIVEKKEGELERAKCKKCGALLICESKSHGTKNLLTHIDTTCPRRDVKDIGQLLHSRSEGLLSTKSSTLDSKKLRELLALAIIKHDLPFRFVEYDGIREIFSYICEDIKLISRNTARSDVMDIYAKEKNSLRIVLSSIQGKLCFTSDLWTSINTDGFICLTGHYVDNDWRLRKKILNFAYMPPPHSGVALYDCISLLINEWKLQSRIFSFTLDNASSNDVFIRKMKDHLSLKNLLIRGGKYLHIRCCAHVLNLIVKDGLQKINTSVEKIIESIKYVKGSQARKVKFLECVKDASIESKKGLRQDVPTRWNSTFLMLESAIIYRRAFSHLKLCDLGYHNCPYDVEWEEVERICKLLLVFYNATLAFSGTKYVTANIYFPHVIVIQYTLLEAINSPDKNLREMAKPMMDKFNKYWSDYNMILAIATVLDPRYKLKSIEYSYKKLYGSHCQEFNEVKEELYELFNVYVYNIASTSSSPQTNAIDTTTQVSTTQPSTPNFFTDFDTQMSSKVTQKSQLDLYLEDELIDRQLPLDVLTFWKGSEARYPQVAHMARDIVSIPISTVASESAFSAGGRVLDKYRSAMKHDAVEALICTSDWLFEAKDDDGPTIDELTKNVTNLRL